METDVDDDATSDTKICQEMEKGSIDGNETVAPVRDDKSAENGDATGTKKEEGEQELEKEVEWPDADNYLQVRISSTRFTWLAILTRWLVSSMIHGVPGLRRFQRQANSILYYIIIRSDRFTYFYDRSKQRRNLYNHIKNSLFSTPKGKQLQTNAYLL